MRCETRCILDFTIVLGS